MNAQETQSTNGSNGAASTPPQVALTSSAVRSVPKALLMKLAQVMAVVERVPKSGHNANHNYDYATEADILAAVRSGLAERHVILAPDVENIQWEKLATKSGGELKLCTVRVRFDVMDAESGELLSVRMVGQGSDSGDKAFYKALTGATKYAVLKLFLIPTGDDPENEKPERNTPPPPAGLAGVKARMPKPTPAPAPQGGGSVRAGHDRSLIYPFGNCKGLPISDSRVDEKSLLFWIGKLQAELNDASKSKWHAKSAQTLATLQAEQRYRAAATAGQSAPAPYGSDGADEPPPPGDEDAPF